MVKRGISLKIANYEESSFVNVVVRKDTTATSVLLHVQTVMKTIYPEIVRLAKLLVSFAREAITIPRDVA